VYQNYASKEALLVHVVTSIIAAAGEHSDAPIPGLAETDDIDSALRSYAREQIGAVIQPRPMQLRRLVIAEAQTFPALGKLFYELGPRSAVDQLAPVLRRLHERGILFVTDERMAATDLNWLIMAEALNRAMLLCEDKPTRSQIKIWADRATDTFLAAYRPKQQKPASAKQSHKRR
jgi:TetR/AcrR family transcriptional regulator, mexJK operon transcriptional repressor